jgi:Peptidase family M1 domain
MTTVRTCPILLLALLALAAPAMADPLPAHAQRVVDYAIDVRLDAENQSITGRERLTWNNPSNDTIGELWFHLYLNAFRNNRSTFFRESGGQLRGDWMREDGWGWTTVRKMMLADGTDLTPRIRFDHPDDDNADDRTVIRVPLPQPVAPRASIALVIEWTAKLPEVFARTGYHRDYFLVGQWFPKIAVYEPAGMRGRTTGGWNCHQFHANSEFYADFGRFRVNITAPKRFVLGATGARTGIRANADGTATHTYEQDDVHDFAWTADPNYVEVMARFSGTADVTADEYAATAALLGRSVDEVRLSDVEIRVLMQRGRLPQTHRYVTAVKLGIKHFGLWYGRYPYRTLTIVDPAPGALGSGGMEYPTLITGGSLALLNYWPFSGVLVPELVAVHEIAHQFWYGLVANNEFEEAWLDEGFASYSSGAVMDLAYGPHTSILRFLGLRLGGEEFIRLQNSPRRTLDRVRQPAWTYSPNAYSFYVYEKPELALRTLENLLGRETMARVLRTYHERWRFRHPSSDDFYAVAAEVSGRDLAWFWNQITEGTGVVDYEVVSIKSQRAAPAEGLFPARDGKSRLIRSTDASRTATVSGPYESRVVIRRVGAVAFPVDIVLRYEGRGPERVSWDGRATWKQLTRTGPHRLLSAHIDPEHRVTLEVSRVNSARRTDPSAHVARAWSARWMFWVQNLLAGIGL